MIRTFSDETTRDIWNGVNSKAARRVPRELWPNVSTVALAPGARIGTYEITAPIGEGGMGAVYRARDTQLDRDVALEVLADSSSNDPDRVARFTRKAQVLASLDHPNIARIFGLERARNRVVLTLDWIDAMPPTARDHRPGDVRA